MNLTLGTSVGDEVELLRERDCAYSSDPSAVWVGLTLLPHQLAVVPDRVVHVYGVVYLHEALAGGDD